MTGQANTPSFITAKQDLRKKILQQRQALTSQDWRAKSESICRHLEQAECFKGARTVLIYISFRQEPDLSLLWENASCRWGLPRCVGQDLAWHQWWPHEPEQLQSGAYGVLEPVSTLPGIEADQVDLILVPAVACDRQGFRLGYGGGFYDRLLNQPQWAHKPTIGIVFEFAYLNQLPTDPWDCPLQGVCTESGLTLRQGDQASRETNDSH